MNSPDNQTSPDPRQWFVRMVAGGAVFGPIRTNGLVLWAAEGRVMPDDEISEDKVHWIPAQDLPELCMDTLIAHPNGSFIGLFHRDVLQELIREGKLPPDVQPFPKSELAQRLAARQMTLCGNDESPASKLVPPFKSAEPVPVNSGTRDTVAVVVPPPLPEAIPDALPVGNIIVVNGKRNGPDSAPKRHALFVGVDQYADDAFKDLRYSVADAAALAGAFSRYGFETSVLTNPKSDALLDAIERRTAGLGPGDVFLFFFAGHGFTAPDGGHLLICSGDRLSFLRHNRAGVPVDLLEEMTNGAGFHRAFLLDACRTDVFAGTGSRGAETRDLALVSLPDAKTFSGTCSVLRSCDRFCPALEFDDLGHGVFTRAVLDLVDDDASRSLPLGEAFVSSLRARMHGILADHGLPGDQNPNFQTNGDPFPLFDVPPATSSGPGAVSPYVVCHRCRRRKNPLDTFLCPGCNHDFCLDHQDAETFLCSDCARKAREKAAQEKAAQEEAERKKAERARQEAAERERREQERREREKREAEERVRKETESNRPGAVFPLTVAGVSFNLRRIPATETQPAFWMGETQVTQALWTAVMGGNPSCYKGDDQRPVESVSWNDCQTFLKKLNARDDVRRAGLEFRLPSEEEWEHACRAGRAGDYCRLKDRTVITRKTLGRVAWFKYNSGKMTHPVGQKQPNAWGLWDMHGNVWEWTQTADGGDRVLRGGSVDYDGRLLTAGCRFRLRPDDRAWDIGFRLAASDKTAGEAAEREQREQERREREKREAEERARKEAERNRPGTVLPVTISGVSFNLRRIPAKGTQPAFWMGETPVTQALWTAVMGDNPSHFKGDDRRPVESVSWNDCQVFLKKLNALDEVWRTGLEFRLPSEEEWEFACRAGSTGKYCLLADGTNITENTVGLVAWIKEISHDTTHPVGQKEPNAWGLCDMHGNVWEWTETADDVFCVNRGGCFNYTAYLCAAGNRRRFSPVLHNRDLGFRLAASDRTAAVG